MEQTYTIPSPLDYSTLKDGWMPVRNNGEDQQVRVQLIRVASNLREDWFRATPQDPYANVQYNIYEVSLQGGDGFIDELQNLQYFFVRADRAVETNHGICYALLVHLPDTSTNDNIYRLRLFLSLQAIPGAPHTILYCKGEAPKTVTVYRQPLPDESQFGRLFPLLRVVAGSKCVPGSVLYSDLASYGRGGDSTSLLFNLIETYKRRLNDYLEATPDAPLSRENKDHIYNQVLLPFIDDRIQNMTAFAQICWLLYLCCMAEEKKLLQRKPGPDKGVDIWDINSSTLERAYVDAVTYSDGILQLLENSCQHTYMRSGYLTLRVYYVDRSVSDADLPRIAATRSMLLRRYRGLSQDRSWSLVPDVHFYLESTVVDDAMGEPVTSARSTPWRGITKVYLENADEPPLSSVDLLTIVNDTVFSDKDGGLHGSRSVSRSHSLSDSQRLANHYGVAALRLIASRSGGGFVVRSPANISETGPKRSIETVCLLPGSAEAKSVEANSKSQAFTTEYAILFPLAYTPPARDSSPKNSSPYSLFDRSLLKEGPLASVSTQKAVLKDAPLLYDLPAFLSPTDKARRVQELTYWFAQKFSGAAVGIHTIFLLDVCSLNGLALELTAKALFAAIYERATPAPGEDNPEQLYAIYFSSTEEQCEFIRLFSIFCNRINFAPTQNASINKVQIALCSKNKILSVPEVNFLLTGGKMASVYETARRFAYYNSESSLPLLSQLKYLAYDTSTSRCLAAFPFDLFLRDRMDCDPGTDAGTGKIADACDCWFMQRIQRLMQNELQKRELGLKIPDVRVHLQSKIHISDFYEAELLFHNIGVLERFAYLIVRYLLQNAKLGSRILLLNYQAYSSLLAQYVAEYLRYTLGKNIKVYNALLYQDERNTMRLLMDSAWEKHTPKKPEKFFGDCTLLALCPIGTTLGTFDSMYECVRTSLSVERELYLEGKNLALILVGSGKEDDAITSRYWTRVTSDPHTGEGAGSVNRVEVLPNGIHESYYVDYFLYVPTEWSDPADPSRQDKALVHTDRSATSLNMIFPLLRSDPDRLAQHDVSAFVAPENRACNNARLACLRGCVTRGHISQGNNHFLVYVDMPKCFYNICHSQWTSSAYSFDSWLSDLHRDYFDPNAFNILVSPLKNIGVPFVKAIIDHVFEHSSRFLHIDLQNARRGDIRAKYSYITQDYCRLRRTAPDIRIRIYYIDDSLVTSVTLQRGLSMLRMLLADEEGASRRNILFDGVFLLLNRSSVDTVRDFVADPHTDFRPFATLCVPHYNTRRDRCPACERQERYRILEARSATSLFAEEYARLYEKHRLRTTQEYHSWIDTQLLWDRSAFARLRQWVADHPAGSSKQQKNARQVIRVLCRTFCEDFWKTSCAGLVPADGTDYSPDALVAALLDSRNRGLRQSFLRTAGQLRLRTGLDIALKAGALRADDPGSFISNSVQGAALKDIWHNEVIAERSLRRTICAHEAYWQLTLEEEPEQKDLSVAIIKYLTLPSPVLGGGGAQASLLARWEWVHSGLKILSRDYVVRHHAVYEFMFDFLRHIAQALLGKGASNTVQTVLAPAGASVPSFPARNCEEIYPLQRYQMFISVLHLLASMQSNYPLLFDTWQNFRSAAEKLTNIFFTERKGEKAEACLLRWYTTALPCEEQMAFDYEKCVKLAAFSNDEQSKCLLIQNEMPNVGHREA